MMALLTTFGNEVRHPQGSEIALVEHGFFEKFD
jgi:hypothetical protein